MSPTVIIFTLLKLMQYGVLFVYGRVFVITFQVRDEYSLPACLTLHLMQTRRTFNSTEAQPPAGELYFFRPFDY